MHTIKLTKFPAISIFIIASMLVVIGVWVASHTPGKNGFDTIPLLWFFVLVCAPLLSIGCTVVLWYQRGRSRWLAVLATLFAIPQCIVCYFAVGGALYYLGFIE